MSEHARLKAWTEDASVASEEAAAPNRGREILEQSKVERAIKMLPIERLRHGPAGVHARKVRQPALGLST